MAGSSGRERISAKSRSAACFPAVSIWLASCAASRRVASAKGCNPIVIASRCVTLPTFIQGLTFGLLPPFRPEQRHSARPDPLVQDRPRGQPRDGDTAPAPATAAHPAQRLADRRVGALAAAAGFDGVAAERLRVPMETLHRRLMSVRGDATGGSRSSDSACRSVPLFADPSLLNRADLRLRLRVVGKLLRPGREEHLTGARGGHGAMCACQFFKLPRRSVAKFPLILPPVTNSNT